MSSMLYAKVNALVDNYFQRTLSQKGFYLKLRVNFLKTWDNGGTGFFNFSNQKSGLAISLCLSVMVSMRTIFTSLICTLPSIMCHASII